MTRHEDDDDQPLPLEFHDRLVNMRKNSSPKKPTTPAMMTAITINCTSPLRICVSSWPSTASISWSLSACQKPRCDRNGVLPPVEAACECVQRRAVHHLQLRHRDAARDAEIFQQIIEPRLLLPRHALAAGHGVDHVLVEEIGDHDPQRGGDGGVGEGRDQVARCAHQVIVDRVVAVHQHFGDQRAGKHQHVDQQKQAGEQQHRTKLVRCDMRVETVRGHDALPVIPGHAGVNPESRIPGSRLGVPRNDGGERHVRTSRSARPRLRCGWRRGRRIPCG